MLIVISELSCNRYNKEHVIYTKQLYNIFKYTKDIGIDLRIQIISSRHFSDLAEVTLTD